MLNSASPSIIIWNSTLVNRQTKSHHYCSWGFLGYISLSSFVLIIFFPTSEMSVPLILASCFCKSWCFIRAPVLWIETFKGMLALMSVAICYCTFFLSSFQVCWFLCLFSHAWVLYYDLFLKSLDYFFEKTERRKRSELHPSWDRACVGIPLPFALPPELLTATCHITSFASDQKSEQKRVVNVIVLFLLHGSL